MVLRSLHRAGTRRAATILVRPIAVRRRKPNPWFKRGTVFRCAPDALRAAGKPVTIRETALAMLAAKGIADAPPRPCET